MKWVFGTMVLGAIATLLLVNEWMIGARSRPAIAVILESGVYGRSGVTLASVSYEVEDRKVVAALRAWFCALHAGEKIPIRYASNNPGTVMPDWFWQRHFGSTIALLTFALVAAAQIPTVLADRRRRAFALLRDDYVGPRPVARGGPALPIDTAPRLWDRQLDG